MKLKKAHLKIYKRYFGDIDMWVRLRKRKENIMTGELWGEIDQLLSRLELMQKGLASESFNSVTNERIEKLCESPEVERELRALVGKYR